eukprot:5168082-Prymnesium_polylepis.1
MDVVNRGLGTDAVCDRERERGCFAVVRAGAGAWTLRGGMCSCICKPLCGPFALVERLLDAARRSRTHPVSRRVMRACGGRQAASELPAGAPSAVTRAQCPGARGAVSVRSAARCVRAQRA